MSNKKRISKKISTSKHFVLKDLEKRNFFLSLENAHLKAQLAIISSQPHKTDYPSGAPEYLNKKNNCKIAGEIGGAEIFISRAKKTRPIESYNLPEGTLKDIERFLKSPDFETIKFR